MNGLIQSNFFLIAGPCAIESREMTFDIAGQIKEIANELEIPFVFKGSYRKANRSRLDSFTGIGDLKALEILGEIKNHFNLLTTTDIHSDEEAEMASNYVDILQIPAFLCRQTSLLVAAAKTGKIVTVKKGQFMSPESMKHAIHKIVDSGNPNVMLIERGNSFGYSDLIVDFRGIPTMKAMGKPVILDCTHSLQQPNQPEGITGGRPTLISTIARAGIAVGVDGLFIETHPKPEAAKSDGANMLPLNQLKPLLEELVEIRSVFKKFNPSDEN